MESFSVSTVLDLQDWQALDRAVRKRLYSPGTWARRLVVRAPFALLFLPLLAGLFWSAYEREVVGFFGGVVCMILLGAIQTLLLRRAALPKTGGLFVGAARYVFDATGVQVERNGSAGRVDWPKVLELENTSTHVYIWLADNYAYVVPVRDLSGGLNASGLMERMRGFMAGAAVTGSPARPADFSVPPPPAQALTLTPRVRVAQELGALGKLLLLLRPDPARLAGSDQAIGLVAGLALVLWLPLDWFIFEGPLQFLPGQAGGLAFVIAGALALAWMLSRLSVPRIEFRRVLLIVAGAMFIAICGSAAFSLLADSYFACLLALLAATAYATYFKRALLALTGFVQIRALLIGAAATLVFVVMMDRLYINPSLWVYTGEEDAELDGGTNYQDAWRRIEDLQFDQRTRIDAEVARIATHSAPGAQVYFVGFAGYGEQRVFAQEIALAAKRVAVRYGSGAREIQLVNDRRDLEKYPLATVRALRHTLVSLGTVMDADDVLFLALSSHGDEDATLSVSNAGMMPGELDVDQVAGALKESGIRWKVIVISACHAGSFIEKLADERTIVMTAAAADRTSFGCSDNRDLTYFGEAFYRDALPRAASLRAAFAAAKVSIEQREKAEGVETSEPQASFGAELEAKLEAPEPR